MNLIRLEDLSKETLVEMARMYARNWQSLDSLWFGCVEAEYGLDAAVKLDLENWERQSVLEAKRIMKVLGLNHGGLESVLRAVSFMSWQIASPLFEIEVESPEKVIFYYPRCPVQESRHNNAKEDFPCKTMKTMLLSKVARVVEPRAVLTCLSCPPDPHPEAYWCRWMLTMDLG